MTIPGDLEYDDSITIPLKDGTNITMSRNEAGRIEICSEDACLEIPGTASEFLGWIEFFKQMGTGEVHAG